MHGRRDQQRAPGETDDALLIDADAVAGGDDDAEPGENHQGAGGRQPFEAAKRHANKRCRERRRQREEINELAGEGLDWLARNRRRIGAR